MGNDRSRSGGGWEPATDEFGGDGSSHNHDRCAGWGTPSGDVPAGSTGVTDDGAEPTVPGDERTTPEDEDESLSFRDRRFGPAFDKRETVIPVGGHRPYDPGEWDDAIVVVEEGTIDITCVDGSHHRFARGDVICLSRMLLAALHNDGDVPALLIAVSRRKRGPGSRTDETPDR